MIAKKELSLKVLLFTLSRIYVWDVFEFLKPKPFNKTCQKFINWNFLVQNFCKCHFKTISSTKKDSDQK